MATLDWVILIFFIAGIFGIVCWVLNHKEDNLTYYFLSWNSGTLLSVGAAIFTAKIGSEHFVGIAGTEIRRFKAG